MKSFVFILPVVHPNGSKVSNYHHVEVALKQTIKSLQNQTYSNVKIVVVCSRVPTWADHLGKNVFFLDVSDTEVFAPNRNDVKVDKGLKYVLGILYSEAHLNPKFYMLADADDYVNSQLAEFLFRSPSKTFSKKEIDGYLVNKGLQVEVAVSPNNELNYGNAYLVNKFNTTCGTCRIFKQENLTERILKVDSEIFQITRKWIPSRLKTIVKVSPDLSIWLDTLCNKDYSEDWHIVNVLGRHIRQSAYFNFLLFPHVGAAKACGHGNHDGPRRGGLHDKKIIGRFPVRAFQKKFGIQEKGSFDLFSIMDFMLRAKFFLNRS